MKPEDKIELAVIDTTAVAYYNDMVSKAKDGTEIALFAPEQAEHGVFSMTSEQPYFLLGANDDLTLCKPYYNPENSLHYSGYSNRSYAFIDKISDTSYTEKDHRGKYRLEIMVEHEEDMVEEAGHSFPKLVAYFDTAGEAMAQAVALNHPDNGVYC